MSENFLLVDRAVVMKWTPRMKKHFVRKGYSFTGMGKEFTASVLDLPKSSKMRVRVRCPRCKEERTITWQVVAGKDSTACQKCASHMANFKDLTGKTFGRLVVLELSDRRGNEGESYYRCICSCGTTKDIKSSSLTAGATRSCGCLQREMAAERLAGLRGDKNYRWDETKSDEDRDSRHRSTGHREWREAVLERGGYECARCGAQDDLHAHHIFPYSEYPEKREDVENGVALCKGCHDKFHIAYGQIGISDVELAMFLTEPI